jgi:hypothetical protein
MAATDLYLTPPIPHTQLQINLLISYNKECLLRLGHVACVVDAKCIYGFGQKASLKETT